MKLKLLVAGNKRIKRKSGAFCERVLFHFFVYMVAYARGIQRFANAYQFAKFCMNLHEFVGICKHSYEFLTLSASAYAVGFEIQ